MNALQHHLPLNALTARLPMASGVIACLELSLPAGWQLLGGTGCQLEVLRGRLWLTDARQENLWLDDGDSTCLAESALASSEADTVLQLYAGNSNSPDVVICPVKRQVRLLAPRTALSAIILRLQHVFSSGETR